MPRRQTPPHARPARSTINLNFAARRASPLFPHHRNSSRHYCQDESQVEKEESSQTEAQEKKDESQIQINDSPRQLDHHGSLI
ncbi:hypothetical protein KCU71_g13829, partial [Aureobasidium melanogenum]